MKKNVEDFIDDILLVCERYKLSISHEDSQGSFIVEDYNVHASEWLRNATNQTLEGGE